MSLTQVTTELLADASITSAKLASGAAAASLANGSVTAAKLATGAAAGNLAAGDVTPAKLSQPLTQGTSQASTSGTNIDFPSIPSWAKRVTVIFSGVSTNGTSLLRVQAGNGSVVSTGYVSGGSQAGSGAVAATGAGGGFDLYHGAPSASDVKHGHLLLTNISAYAWVASWVIVNTNNGYTHQGGGTISLASALDRVRITTVNGTDTFDAGSVNIIYE